MSQSEFLTEKRAMKLINEASVADQEDFIQVDISDTIIQNMPLDAPFFDFLKDTKNRVFPTDSAEGAFRRVEVPEEARSKFAETEDAEDIANIEVSFDKIKYASTVVARKIKSTTLLETGSPDFDPMDFLRQQATQDNFTAIDEGLFTVSQPKKFDGLFETSNNVTNMNGDFVTIEDVNLEIRKIMNRGGRPDGVICTGGALDQLVASDDKENKKVYVDKAEVILGKYSTQIMTPVGLVPLIPDANANNRFAKIPAYMSDSITIVDSSALEIAVQEGSISKELGATGFADSELVGTFLRMGNLNPNKNAVIKGIGSSLDSQKVLFVVRHASTDKPLGNVAVTTKQTINGHDIEKSRLTDIDGKVTMTVNSTLPYHVKLAKAQFTTYEEDVAAGSSSLQEPILVPT